MPEVGFPFFVLGFFFSRFPLPCFGLLSLPMTQLTQPKKVYSIQRLGSWDWEKGSLTRAMSISSICKRVLIIAGTKEKEGEWGFKPPFIQAQTTKPSSPRLRLLLYFNTPTPDYNDDPQWFPPTRQLPRRQVPTNHLDGLCCSHCLEHFGSHVSEIGTRGGAVCFLFVTSLSLFFFVLAKFFSRRENLSLSFLHRTKRHRIRCRSLVSLTITHTCLFQSPLLFALDSIPLEQSILY